MDAKLELPPRAKEWIDNADAFATLVTIEPSGQPHASMMWIGRDGEDILFSTIANRRKHLNMVADPRVTVVVFPASDPYSYVEVRGDASIEVEGGHELISRLCLNYMGHGVDQPQEGRIVVRVRSRKVIFHPSRDLRKQLDARDGEIHQC